MNYINKGKRDILIIPKCKNIEKIQLIREKYDELSHLVPPHITLAFPFENDITNEELKLELVKIFKNYKPFNIKCKGISLHEDTRVNTNYIFLDLIDGKEVIKQIHDLIYEKILYEEPAIKYNYIPHITLGTTNNKEENIELQEEFDMTIDSVIVESIGENEESIIEFEIKL